MRDPSSFERYRGDGSEPSDRGPTLEPGGLPASLTDPAGYLAEPGLRAAVNVALELAQPLVVTGEPGTGKTQLAASVAFELGLGSPLVFNTKTTSTARDLFYRYDALGHFHAAHFRSDTARADEFVTYEALGLACLLTRPPAEADPFLPPPHAGRGPVRSVVLVDEIDKAPRDLPNDLLDELESMTFTCREAGRSFAADPALRPVVVVTSNSERNLPDAFLRRCVYYHIEFPDEAHLLKIVERRLPGAASQRSRTEAALRLFEAIRRLDLRKRPATAELLAWLRILERLDLDPASRRPADLAQLRLTSALLAKSPEDIDLVRRRLADPS